MFLNQTKIQSKLQKLKNIIIPPQTKMEGGLYRNHLVRLSLCAIVSEPDLSYASSMSLEGKSANYLSGPYLPYVETLKVLISHKDCLY